MAVLDILEILIDNFTNALLPLKISFCSIFILVLVQIIACVTGGWVSFSVDENNAGKEGLWRHCEEGGVYTCCESLNDYLSGNNFVIPGWIHISRAFQIIGIISGFTVLICTILCTIVTQTHKTLVTYYVNITLNACTVGASFFSVVTYASGYSSAEWIKGQKLHVSFGFAITVMCFYLINLILVIIGTWKLKAQLSRVNPSACVNPSGAVPSFIRVQPAQAMSSQPISEDRPVPSAPPVQPAQTVSSPPISEDRSVPTARSEPVQGNECTICMDAAVNCLLEPCNHVTLCEGCAANVRICPQCRVTIQSRRRVFT